MFTFREYIRTQIPYRITVFYIIAMVLYRWLVNGTSPLSVDTLVGVIFILLAFIHLYWMKGRLWLNGWGLPRAAPRPLTAQQEAYWRGTYKLSRWALGLDILYLLAGVAYVYYAASQNPLPESFTVSWHLAIQIIRGVGLFMLLPMVVYELLLARKRRQVRRRHPAFMQVGRNHKLVNVRS